MAGEMVESKEWYVASYAPQGVPTSDHLKLRSRPLPGAIPDHHVALEMLWISVDPFLRPLMSGNVEGLYLPPFQVNEAVKACVLGRVIKSTDGNFSEGDIVTSPFSPVADYCVSPTNFLTKIDPASGISFPDYLNCLGLAGFTAWVGIEVLGDPKPGSNVFISAAAGGVGLVAGQLAKLRGCRVVGSTGSDDKVKLLKEEFGYDDAFNYKEETDFNAALSKYFPDGIDMYFENVGGKMLEAVLNNVNKHAKILVCGMISEYNKVWTEREGVRNLMNMVGKEVRMEGFMVGSYLDRHAEFGKVMEEYIKQGKIRSRHKIFHGIESFLDSIGSIFSGSSAGKVVIQVKP